MLPRLNGALARQLSRCSPAFLPMRHPLLSRYIASSIAQKPPQAKSPRSKSPRSKLHSSKIEPSNHDYTHVRFISTLDPSRLTPSDYQSLSKNTYAGLSPRILWPHDPLSDLGSKVDTGLSVSQQDGTPYPKPNVSFVQYARDKGDKRGKPIFFPDDAKGFFYYHTPSKASPVAGQVRFRITPSADPASWSSGRDLCWPHSSAEWKLDLMKIIRVHPMFAALHAMLLAEKLISPELVKRCMKLVKWRGTLGPQTVLNGLEQPFYTTFSARDRGQFAVIGREDAKSVHVRSFFRDLRSTSVDPYTGSAFCRFELYNSEHTPAMRRDARIAAENNQPPPRQLVLRVLEIVDPVSCCTPGYDGFVNRPREGELMTFGLSDNDKRPWHYNLDTETVYPPHRGGRHSSLEKLRQNLVGLRLLLDYHTDSP